MFNHKLFRVIVLILILTLGLVACGGVDSAEREEAPAEVFEEPPSEEEIIEPAVDEAPVEVVSADPTPGLFKGTTSQGLPISLRVEEVNGQMMITSMQYNIKMAAQDWSVTTEMYQPDSRQIAIESGEFSGHHEEKDTVEKIAGKFVGDEGAEGRLQCTHEHPQGLGTAIGDVTFVIHKTNS